ncbi:hypothetical protein O181_108737 [Austropuccinia psidii MF-1]|uniref:Uncharacterized protein n=1 Tax=Austropuccinia psidii MF-1 TaxID=1389203 RepID=A0A9Q3JUS9_9BASI|nr:hypothetical protein [Austropuccinia psidii MF-1]
MVYTRNGSNYSVQADGCGQGRGKTKSRSAKSSSRKTHLEDARVAPHSPRSVPTDFDVNCEPKLIHHNISRAEPFSSGSNRNISMPIQKLVQSSQRRGSENMPKALAGGHELLLTHQELSGSGKDQITVRRLEPIVLKRQGQKDKELAEEPQSFIHRPEERVGNDFSFGNRRNSGVYQLQTSSRTVQGQAQRTSEEAERSQDPSGQRQSQSQLAQTIPIRVQDSQIGAFSHGQCIQHAQNSDGIHSQGAGKDEQDFSMKITYHINHLKNGIDVELAKSDSERQKLKNEIISNVEEIHKNSEPHMPRNSTPLTEEKFSVKGSLTPFLGKNVISAKDSPKLAKWPTFSGEGEYNHIEFIRTIDVLQEDFRHCD